MKPRNPTRSGEIRKEIAVSFASSEYPGDSHLVVLNPEEDHDSAEILERLQGRSWQDLLTHLEEIEGPEFYWYCWVYSMITPEAFYYYLPAFLVIAMDLDSADTVGEYLILQLSGREDDDFLRPYSDELTRRLTPRQRSAIQGWVLYLLEEWADRPNVERLEHWLNPGVAE